MKKRRSNFLLILLALTAPFLWANAQGQIPVGTWRMHSSYTTVVQLCGNSTTLFAKGDQSCFYFSVEDQTSHPLTKKDGLYGQDFNKMAFSDLVKTLVLAYPDGTLDLVKEDKITTLNTIRDNDQFQDKTIHSIKTQTEIAWLATAFGLVKLDLEKGTILDSFTRIGPEGSSLPIWDVAIEGEALWITTPQGLWVGPRSANLKDFRNWENIHQEIPIAQLYFSRDSLFGLGLDKSIYQWNGNNWEWIMGTADVEIFKAIQNQLYFFADNTIYSLNENGTFQPYISSIDIEISDFQLVGGKLYLATNTQGVLAWESSKSILPNGPKTSIKSINLAGNEIFGLSISLENDGRLDSAILVQTSLFKNGSWKMLQAPSRITVLKYVNQILYVGTWDDGLWKKEGGQWEKISLPGLSPQSHISDITADGQNNLWLALIQGPEKLIKINQGEARSIEVPGLVQPVKIKADQAGNLWILEGTTGNQRLRIFNQEGGINRILSSSQSLGNLPSARVLDFDINTNGELWIGTANGIAYLSSIWSINTNSIITATTPFYQNRPLLAGQEIQAIQRADDGSLWLGTNNEGLWHYYPEQETLYNFRKSNSPLPSNNIQQLVLEPVFGELFVKTDGGALSYRGTSIPAANQLADLKIFPNPIRPGFSGLISIEGLTEGAALKITNSVGRVVYSWQARGGKSTWNLRDAKGNRVPPGVYMVYVINEMGTEKIAGKFLVL